MVAVINASVHLACSDSGQFTQRSSKKFKTAYLVTLRIKKDTDRPNMDFYEIKKMLSNEITWTLS